MQKKRPWFQIHLSTAILLMLVAGALMWANIKGREKVIRYADVGEVAESDHHYSEYGWPFKLLPAQFL